MIGLGRYKGHRLGDLDGSYEVMRSPASFSMMRMACRYPSPTIDLSISRLSL